MMSSNEFTEIEQIEWENAAQRVFNDCLASSSTSSLSPLSSTTSTATVETLADSIEKRATGKYRNKHLLDGLRKSIEEFSSDGRVNFASFKEAVKRWVKNIEQQHQQNGNNIVTKDDSRSNDKKQRSANSSDNDQDFEILFGEPRRKNENSRKFTVTADFVDLVNVSSYSPSSDTTHGCAMSDTAPESADSGCGVAVGIGDVRTHDLRMQIQRFSEENSMLWEEFVRSEELSAGLRRQLENLRTNFNQTTAKCLQLERKNDELQELLGQMEEKERDCRWSLKKMDKERNSLARKLDVAEAEIHLMALLGSKLEKCKKEKYDCIREFTMCRRELEEKQRECEMLEDELAQISEVNKNLQESHEKSIQCLRDEIHELKYDQSVLRTPDTVRSPSDGNSPTTPTTRRVNFYTSSPSCRGDRLHESLFEELKASGFSAANESRVCELEDELSWYQKKIHQAVTEINKVTNKFCFKKPKPQVPDVNLNDTNEEQNLEVSSLIKKILELSDAVNEIIRRPAVKDAGSQVSADSNYTNEQLYGQFGIRSFQDEFDSMIVMEIPPYVPIATSTKSNDETEHSNNYENLLFSPDESSISKDTLTRPSGRDIGKEVTYRKSPSSRQLNFSDFPLPSRNDYSDSTNQTFQEKSVDLSEIVPLPDAESTSNDSSSKIFAVQPNSKLSLSLTSIEPRTDVQTHHALSAVTEGNNAANVSPVTVALAMSSGEDSSDSECDPMAIRENDNAHFEVGNETRSISPTVLNFVGGALLGTSTPASINNNNENCINNNNVKKPDDIPDHQTKESIVPKREKREDRLRQRNPVSQEELPSEDPR